ncbi:hypothetical protein ANO11243_042160 [Dothideomycetidae sp. 11243]|nr:hypothetical protein ANO11243_042160 [fungal sp. No.11243]
MMAEYTADEPVRSLHSQKSDDDSQSTSEPLLRLALNDLRHPATKVFLENFHPTDDLAPLSGTVIKLLYPSESVDSTSSMPRNITRRSAPQPVIPGTKSITLIMKDMPGVAYTSGSDLDNSHKDIAFSLAYINHVVKTSADPAATNKEIHGVICHELVHCWQWDALGTAPGGLIEGIADWVRLRAGFVPPHWTHECGAKWDAGYHNTGYFLDWIERQRGAGSVSKINAALRQTKYNEEKFWKGLFGKSVNELWSTYCKTFHGGDEMLVAGKGRHMVAQKWI